MGHISDHDLERYHLGMVAGAELVALEDHIIGCGDCADRATEAAAYVDAVRAGIVAGDFDRNSQFGRSRVRQLKTRWHQPHQLQGSDTRFIERALGRTKSLVVL